MEEYFAEKRKYLETVGSVKKLAISCGFKHIGDKCDEVVARMKKDQFIITVVGEFNRGKSTLLSAILGVDIIPTSIRPTTATINIIHYAETPSLVVHMSDSSTIAIAFSKECFNSYTALADFDPRTVKYVEIAYPLDFLRDGTVLVDTPGVEDIDEHRKEITYGYIPMSDAIVMLFDATMPIKQTEKTFLSDQVLSSKIPAVFYVVNHVDKLPEEERQTSLHFIHEELCRLLKIDSVEVYPISALQALRGKVNNNRELLGESGLPQFENALKRFILSNDRATAKLIHFKEESKALSSLFLEEIAVEEMELGRTKEELESKKNCVMAVEEEALERFDKLTRYIDEQMNGLSEKLEVALIKDLQAVRDELLYRLDLSSGDLTLFARKILPHEIEKSLKRWIEGNMPSLEKYIDAIVEKTINGYEKYFAIQPIVDRVFPGTDLLSTHVEQFIDVGDPNDIEKIRKRSSAAGALILGGLAFCFAGANPIYPVMMALSGSSVGEHFVGGYFAKQKAEEQKERLKKQLPSVLEEAYKSLLRVLRENMGKTSQSLKDSLQKAFVDTMDGIKDGIQQKIIMSSTEGGALLLRKNDLDRIRAEMIEITNRLDS